MSNTNRRTEILNRLCAHLLELCGVAVVTPPRDAWQAFEINGSYRYGWAPPMPVDGDELCLLVAFCPELIAATTQWLDDEQLDVYLTTVETYLDEFIEHFGEDTTVIRQRVDGELHDTVPEALDLLSEVEARALDAGIAA